MSIYMVSSAIWKR